MPLLFRNWSGVVKMFNVDGVKNIDAELCCDDFRQVELLSSWISHSAKIDQMTTMPPPSDATLLFTAGDYKGKKGAAPPKARRAAAAKARHP